MSIGGLSEFFALLLAIALCTERLVTIAKTAFPGFLSSEPKTEAYEVDLKADKWRRLVVQAIAFVAAWVTTAFLAEGDRFALAGTIAIGQAANAPVLPVWLVGLLASGGSALWSSLLGYSSAVRDSRRQQVSRSGLEHAKRAMELGREPPKDFGEVGGGEPNVPAAPGSEPTASAAAGPRPPLVRRMVVRPAPPPGE